MNKDTHTKEYLQKLASLKLSDSSRVRMEKNLLEYAQFHSVSDGVRVGEEVRSIEQVPLRTSLFSLKRMYMPFVILFAVMITGGTSFAAQGAVPGDFLYTVKTEVNEPVRSAFAVGANAEAKLQTKIIAERIKEAEELKSEGKLEGKVAAKLAANIQTHVAKATKANIKSTETVRAQTTTGLTLAIERFNSLVENDTALAIGVSAENSEVSGGAALGTTLAAGKIDPEMLRVNTQTRVESLIKVVKKNESELSAQVFLSLNKKLDQAHELVIESQTQAEVEAQQSLIKAAKLAGEVESKLTTLGTAEIDADTGTIIDIDFGTVPALELNIGTDGRVDGSSDESNTEAELEVQTNSTIKAGTDQVEASANGSLRSGLSL